MKKKFLDLFWKERTRDLEADVSDHENWLDVMIPYADLMTIILIFFVFFFIFSSFNADSSDLTTVEIDSTEVVVKKSLLDSLWKLEELKSNILPPCQDWLFNVTIVGDNQFVIQGRTYSINDIYNKYGTQIDNARRFECVNRIRISANPTISLIVYQRSVKLLQRYFYCYREDKTPISTM
ncbi:MAG: hypothetical protein H8D22_11860 [Candidatus Cloacimonetes bacterium]|nr:hypothetical protein [Candidatus Cloacimonadota bacterium]